MVQEPFPMGPQKTQGLDDSTDCQGLHTEICYTKKHEARIKVHHELDP